MICGLLPFLVGSCCFAGASSAATLKEEFVVSKWETEDGLPENSANSAFWTPDGFMWIGTYNGLVRFDGVEMRIFDSRNTPGLHESSIVNLHCDTDGRLWVGTGSGIVSFDRGVWRQHGVGSSWDGLKVRFFVDSGAGQLFATSFGGAICRINGDELDELPPPVPDRPMRGYHGTAGADGKLWVYRNDYFGCWDGERWRSGGAAEVNAVTNGFQAAMQARGGGAWALTQDSLIRLRDGQMTSKIALTRPVYNVWSAYEDENGEIWAASYQDGTFRISRNGEVSQMKAKEGGLTSNAIRFVKRGPEGNLWVGTSGGGLMRLRPKWFRTFGLNRNLGSPVIKSVIEEKKDAMLLATFGGGVARLDLTGADPALKATWSTPAHAQCVLKDSKGRVWMGGHGNFLFVRENGATSPVKHGNGVPNNVRALFEDSQGAIWIGAGPSVFRDGSDGLERILTDNRDVVRNARGFAEHPKDGSIWVVSSRGVHRYAGRGLEAVEGNGGRAAQGAMCAYFDDAGTLWLGTRHRGLLCLRDGIWSSVGEDQGLPTPLVGNLVDDGRGAFWLGTDRGIARVTRASLEAVIGGSRPRIDVQYFGQADGLVSGETAWGFQPSVVRDSSGRLWFPTIKGVAMAEPDRFAVSSVSVAPILTAAEYLARSGMERSMFAASGQEAAVEAGGHDLRFRFAAPNFSAPDRVRYEHALFLNGELAQQGISNERELRFALLPPGEHRLEIRAFNHHGVEHPEPAVFQFSVSAYYWQTTWFRAGVVLLAVAIAGAIVWQVRSYELRLAQGELERERAVWESEELRRLAMEVARLEMWEWRLESGELRGAPGLRTLFSGETSGARFQRMEECLEFVHPDDRGGVDAAVATGVESEGQVHMEFRVIWTDGSTHWLEGREEVLNDAGGRPARIIGMMVDATARKRAEEERRWLESTFKDKERTESLGAMASGIAHDFNNLLTAIMCNIGLVQSRLERDSEGKGMLSEAEKAADRAADLCRQMVAYAGKGQFVREEIDLGKAVQSVESELQKIVGQRIALEFGFAREIPTFTADPAQIGQLITNLVENAAEAIGEGREGVVVVETEEVDVDEAFLAGREFALAPPIGRGAALRVRDTGGGLGEAEKSRIFEPFYSSKFLGRGLGLAAVMGIVRALGGGIAAQAGPEGGMVFEIWFPESDDAESQVGEPPANGTERREGRFRALVIDDEDAVLETTRNSLAVAGFEALTARSGAEGVALLQSHQTETAFVIMDLIMPGIDGVETLGALRRVDDNIPIFLMSGLSEEEAMGRFSTGDLAGFVKKPFSARQLVEQICEVVDGKGPVRTVS